MADLPPAAPIDPASKTPPTESPNPWNRRLGFWWIAEDQPQLPAILEGPDGPRTYAELAGDAHQLARLFRASGAVAGDAVGALADNGNTLIEVSLACQESGLHFIPLNTHLTAHELGAIIEHSGAAVLVIGERFAPLLVGLDEPERAPAVFAIGSIPGITSLAEARAAHPRTEPTDRR